MQSDEFGFQKDRFGAGNSFPLFTVNTEGVSDICWDGGHISSGSEQAEGQDEGNNSQDADKIFDIAPNTFSRIFTNDKLTDLKESLLNQVYVIFLVGYF